MKKAIVITTIFEPSKAIQKLAEYTNFELFVAGDNKTPSDWNYTGVHYISKINQNKKYPHFSGLVAENHYARKNFGYLEAIQNGAEYIYETDDDNIPNSFFPNFIEEKRSFKLVDVKTPFNIYSLFTKTNVWPRGFPLSCLRNKNKFKFKNKRFTPLIQQGLADKDPDVDAIYRLTSNKPIKFQKDLAFVLGKYTYCPVNSQNTYWHKKVFSLLYLPSTVDSRVSDIWRGYIAQRILWEINSNVIYISPCVYQHRNVHNYLKDFICEGDLYKKTEELLNILNQIKLDKLSLESMLRIIYRVLIKHMLLLPAEIDILNGWLKYVKIYSNEKK